jgi:hypothetical protein
MIRVIGVGLRVANHLVGLVLSVRGRWRLWRGDWTWRVYTAWPPDGFRIGVATVAQRRKPSRRVIAVGVKFIDIAASPGDGLGRDLGGS